MTCRIFSSLEKQPFGSQPCLASGSATARAVAAADSLRPLAARRCDAPPGADSPPSRLVRTVYLARPAHARAAHRPRGLYGGRSGTGGLVADSWGTATPGWAILGRAIRAALSRTGRTSAQHGRAERGPRGARCIDVH